MYSSNSGVWPGSSQPEGLVMRATLRASVPEFTRPMNSSIFFGGWPAAWMMVGAVMWSFLLEPQFGPFVHLANALVFGGTDYFSSSLILPTIIVIVIWEWTGYNMVILYTALRSVPRDVIEAAILDDTSLWKIILKVKLPMVRPAIVLLVFINTIGALQLFTEPLILQYFETQAISVNFTPTLYIYNTAIAGGQYNLAAAAAVILGVVIVIISVSSLFVRRRRSEV